MFPVDPTQYHPVSLLAHLRPDVKFTYTILNPVIHANCVIGGIPFTGLGNIFVTLYYWFICWTYFSNKF